MQSLYRPKIRYSCNYDEILTLNYVNRINDLLNGENEIDYWNYDTIEMR